MTKGDTISRYRIIGPLGRGGMGVVYHAEDTRLHRPVALKFPPPDSLTDHDKQRFLNEAQAAALIGHPNICPIYDIDEVDGKVFIAMAYLDGEPLSRKIERGPLPIYAAVEIAIQIANGLKEAHGAGIVHRDIKSSNIIIGFDGHVSILDFGLALRSGATRLTVAGNAVGTPAYMSPEQAKGLDVDRRSDLWSLGVVLFEMVTGTLPFRREHGAAVVHAIVTEEPPSLSSLRPDVPAELQKVVETALAKSPERRWQTARQMMASLEQIREQGGRSSRPRMDSTQSMAATSYVSVQKPSRGKRQLIMAVLALTIVILLGSGWFYGTRGRPDAVPPASSILQLPEEKQVAILPFEIIGGAAGAQTISDGLVEILTSALSDFERFQGKIIAVPASEIRRRSINSAAEARRIYGVNLVITGSAQPLGDTPSNERVQFTVNLVDATKLRQLSSRTFEYDPKSPVVSRNRAVDHLARLLGFSLTPEARSVLSAGDTAAPGAYTAYLQGRGFLSRYDVAGNLDKAVASFQNAMEHDPNYALAYAGLGHAYVRKLRATEDKQFAGLAVENAERAVRLDGTLPIVHAILGEVYGSTGREVDAIGELKKALDLAPGNAEAYRELARVYTILGRFSEAEAAYVQATKIRPTDWYCYLLLALFYYQQEERYKEAEAALKKAKELTPDNDLVYRNLGAVYQAEGRYKEAVEELQNSLRIKSNPTTFATLAATYYLQHRFQEAVSAMETAIDLNSNRYYFWGNLGIYYKWAPGSQGKSATALRKAIELAEKLLEVTPNDYDVRANLAEYRSRLGDKKGTLAEIERIPSSARRARASRITIAYELTGNRAGAIEHVRSTLKNPATLSQIKDDPDLASLWNDPLFQRAIQAQ